MNLRHMSFLSGASLRAWLVALMMSLLVVAAGCDDDDDDNGTGPGTGPTYEDLNLNLNAFGPNLNQTLRFVVIDTNTNDIVAVGVLDSLLTADTSVTLPRALETDGDYRIELWADINNDDAYDEATDNAWVFDIPENGTADFTYTTTLDTIDADYNTTGEDVILAVTEFTPHIGQLMEVRVVDAVTGRTVGMYRTMVTSPNFAVTIPGVAEAGRGYNVDFFADLNNNGLYDAPPTDHAWRLTGTGTGGGLTLSFLHNTDFTDVAFQ